MTIWNIDQKSYNSKTNGANETASSESLLGYLDEVRISIGTQRYTGNFTAPTAQFPT